mmetsp:Transcript_1433/g.3145  ORF Transcript_1433/g.3145 Transcript_1433/m.3145 type:complete len:118 (-) Transcript_1433:95-448(-)
MVCLKQNAVEETEFETMPQRNAYQTRGEWIAAQVAIRQAEAEKAREPIMEILNAPEYTTKHDNADDNTCVGGITVQTFWISNQVSITNAPFELLTKLAELEQVERTAESVVANLDAT